MSRERRLRGAPLSRVAMAAWLLVALLALGAIDAPDSNAAPASPHWSILSESQPTFFKAGDPSDAYVLVVRNDGGLATIHGSTVTVSDALPPGVTATKITAAGEAANGSGSPRYQMTCPQGPVTGIVTCTYDEGPEQGSVLPGAMIVLTIDVSVPAGVTALAPNSATVSGGGAPIASTSDTVAIDPSPVPFGLSLFRLDVVQESGEVDTRAGSHPFELTTSFAFNVSARESPSAADGGGESPLAEASPKDLEIALPPGLLGNPNAVPRCSQQAFLERENLNCPVDTQVGTVKPFFYGAFGSAVFPVFNVVPPPGQPAELGISVARVGHIPLFFRVRSDGDYGMTALVGNIPETGPLQGAILTLWGVPADSSHDLEREGTLGEGGQAKEEFCKPKVKVQGGIETQVRCPSDVAARPFLTLPSRCQGQLSVAARGDSWQSPQGEGGLPLGEDMLSAMTGCERLSFSPSLALASENAQAGAPSGYTIKLHIPQNEDPNELATPAVSKAVLRLPAGAVLSPAVADGLLGCSREQFGLHVLDRASCPGASQIGTVKIGSPLLSSPLEGQVFVGAPECAPCSPADAREGRLLRLLLQAGGSGVTVKLEGSVSIDQSTGQLTATFRESPQWPFEDLELTLNGGSRAPLANPSSCGTALTASSELTPFSSEAAAELASEPFEVSGCSPSRFQPSFIAGTTDNQAGAFSPATITFSRTDRDEDLERLTVHMPPGLLGMLSRVQACHEAQAQAGECEPESRIGTATVGAGPGANPLFLGGSVHLTGPYDGAPFGLAIEVPAIAGPFDLGTIEVRARIDVNPRTTALTITSDPLPQSLDGIPLRLKTVNLSIDREGFVFNPTNCRALAIQGVLESSRSSTALDSSRFQAANCATLPFKPRLTALTHARTSKAGGVYLHVKVVSGSGQANVAKVKVDLPKHLSSRLTTLQSACTDAVFLANPANCPAASAVGSATAITPVLNAPLTGRAYLVSHGGSALPDLELGLHGEGVTLHVDGQTSLKQGIVSATFRSLPDAPFSTFDLVLDNGPHSLLAANLPAKARGSMCGRSLAMPIAITGQNGAVLKQTTKVAVSGCPRHRA